MTPHERRNLPARMLLATFLSSLAFLFILPPPARAEDRAERVRNDREEILADGQWIYNDLPRGFEEARRTGKPLLVVFRCIPCQACRGFDEQVASLDPRVRDLLRRFVRVRVPQANGVDLSLFQFDYDLSFYAFTPSSSVLTERSTAASAAARRRRTRRENSRSTPSGRRWSPRSISTADAMR